MGWRQGFLALASSPDTQTAKAMLFRAPHERQARRGAGGGQRWGCALEGQPLSGPRRKEERRSAEEP